MTTIITDAFEMAILQSEAEQAGKERQVQMHSMQAVPALVISNFQIVDYSEKALAVFGDTRSVKDELKALGGRFNPKLTHKGRKKAGWVFSKSKERDLRELLTDK
jgi:hypothetical protein